MSHKSPIRSDLIGILAHIDRNSFEGDEAGRLTALKNARALCQRLETPWEALTREIWLAPSLSVAIKISQDIGLFTALTREGDGKSTSELGTATSSDPTFLARILRCLASNIFVEETSTGCFRGTELTQSFTMAGFIGGMDHLFTQVMPTFQALPRFMSETNYVCPEDPTRGPFLYGVDTHESFFEWLTSHPVEGKGFNELMALAHNQASLSWVDKYPVSRLLEGVELTREAPLVVDIGGGIGADMENLRLALLPEQYRIVVQDLHAVVEHGRKSNTFLEFQEHDFFQEQPVKGARAYFLHSILHDWPDQTACHVLRKIKSAMRPGYSKLLLCELIVPEQARYPLGGTLDLVMMGLLCSRERTKSQWEELLKVAGFRITQTWSSHKGGHGIIEAEQVLSAKV